MSCSIRDTSLRDFSIMTLFTGLVRPNPQLYTGFSSQQLLKKESTKCSSKYIILIQVGGTKLLNLHDEFVKLISNLSGNYKHYDRGDHERRVCKYRRFMNIFMIPRINNLLLFGSKVHKKRFSGLNQKIVIALTSMY